ncbi:MAG TPA: phosphoribosyl-AMP cyclohydrolase [Candidatus Kryptonia bacterium]|nr:phosphoribosyl-AMP cyclohydrolase [Candidatus Kryptonia bacterium]
MQQPNFDKRGGLVTVITQDADNGEVLMLAYMNRQAWERTLATKVATYWSTSRNELWRKGETSGNTQEVVEVRIDCDADAVLLKVRQHGPACHEGYRSCFFRVVGPTDWRVAAERMRDPAEMYGSKS